jgi:hypothetical protein
MAENGTGPAGKDSRHSAPLDRKRPVPHGVHPRMEPMKARRSQSPLDFPSRHPYLAQLP